MSKHNKPYHNYNNYSANTNAAVENEEMKAVTETSRAAGLRADISPVDEVAEIAVTEPTEEPTSTPKTGVVNCELLRMRKAANTKADVICTLPEGTEVQINENDSTNEFYAVTTSAGAEGFCMKQFITIK
jgi:uncharacterized protein YgiM (DUF1202 family)